MRQKKSFFTKNNSLNKVGGQTKPKFTASEDTLLDAKTLSEFERVSPGFSDKLFALAKEEQNHIQKIADVKAGLSRSAYRIGRMSFVLIFIAICYFTYNLILNNMVNEAFIFAGISFASLIWLNYKKGSCGLKSPEEKSLEVSKPPYNNKKHHSRRRHFKRK